MEQRVRQGMTYREKLAQADREAKAAVVCLALTIIVWFVCGIGLSGLDAKVLGTPVWIIGGTVGTWVFAIVAAIVLGKRVFVDFDLDDAASSGAQATQGHGDERRGAEGRVSEGRADGALADGNRVDGSRADGGRPGESRAAAAERARGEACADMGQATEDGRGVPSSSALTGEDGGRRG